MSSGNADEVAEKAAVEARKDLSKRTKAGEITSNPRKKKDYIGSVEPRNEIERMFMERFDTVTPVPKYTLRRKKGIIQAAILYIHYNVPFESLGNLTGVDGDHLKTVRRADKWDEFAQELAQLRRPSNLALVPDHDMAELEVEMERRKESLPKLRAKEESIVSHLRNLSPGTKAEATALSNLKKVRDIINETIGLGDYMREISAARATIMKGQALRQLTTEGDSPQQPRSTKGKVLDISTR